MRLGLVFLGFMLLVVGGIGATFLSVNQMRRDGVVINLAGAQRILSQKMTKEALLIAGGRGDEAVVESFRQTAALFERRLMGLLNGDEELSLPRARDQQAVAALEKVKATWSGLAADIQSIGGSKPGADVTEAVARLVGASSSLLSDSNLATQSFEAENNRKINILLAVLAVFAGLAGAVLILGGVLVRATIVHPIVSTAKTLEQLARDGADPSRKIDLTRRLPVQRDDEIGRMTRSLNWFLETVQSLIREAGSSARSVLEAAGELATASEQSARAAQDTAGAVGRVASGAQEQARDVAGVRQTMEEVRQTIEQIASGAHQTAGEVQAALELLSGAYQALESMAGDATRLAGGASRAAGMTRESGKVVGETLAGMSRIRSAVSEAAARMKELEGVSGQIGEITGVISEIAEQTNLLALNAAIEAARAGEQGRGFAVVADEVRKLAERSADSAKEIAGLIETIQGRTGEAVKAMELGMSEVERGSEQAAETGRVLETILEGVEVLTRDIQEIARKAGEVQDNSRGVVKAFEAVAAVTEENTAATEEMAAGAAEVTRSAEKIASVAQQNATAAAEVSSAAEELNASAEEMASFARSLAQIAQGLQGQVARFSV